MGAKLVKCIKVLGGHKTRTEQKKDPRE